MERTYTHTTGAQVLVGILVTLATIGFFVLSATTLHAIDFSALFSQRGAQLAAVSGFTSEQVKAYWDFNEGEGVSLSDASLRGNTGTAEGGFAWVSGREGTALSFVDGGYVRVRDGQDVDLTTSFTVMAWVKSTAHGNGGIVSKRGSSDGSVPSYELNVRGGSLEYRVGAKVFTTPDDVLEQDTWAHVVVTYQTSAFPNMRMFVNGERVHSDTVVTPIKSSGDFVIGQDVNGQAFPGVIDEVRVYKRTFLDTEITKVYELYRDIPIPASGTTEEGEGNGEEQEIPQETLNDLFAKLAQAFELVALLQEAIAKLHAR